MLYIVATPIGNLEDITLRALDVLKKVDRIICEDTRYTKRLLDRYEIKKPLLSYHSHSGEAKVEKIIDLLQTGENLALVSDAGTPGISDPGYKVVKAATDLKIPVIPIPGTSAFLTALMASGLPINQFIYLGFLPLKKGRQTLFKTFKDEKRTIVFYESTHRLQKTLGQLQEYLGSEREIVVARELTKKFEEFERGSLGEIVEKFQKQKPKGEFVIILKGV